MNVVWVCPQGDVGSFTDRGDAHDHMVEAHPELYPDDAAASRNVQRERT